MASIITIITLVIVSSLAATVGVSPTNMYPVIYLSRVAQGPDDGTPPGPSSYAYKGEVMGMICPVTNGKVNLVNTIAPAEDVPQAPMGDTAG